MGGSLCRGRGRNPIAEDQAAYARSNAVAVGGRPLPATSCRLRSEYPARRRTPPSRQVRPGYHRRLAALWLLLPKTTQVNRAPPASARIPRTPRRPGESFSGLCHFCVDRCPDRASGRCHRGRRRGTRPRAGPRELARPPTTCTALPSTSRSAGPCRTTRKSNAASARN